MKRKLAFAGAVVSGLYLLTLGIFPDPIPFIDEGVMILLFAKSMGALGYDVGKFLPFLGRGKKGETTPSPVKSPATGPVVDV